MFINKVLCRFQNSRFANFLSDSLIFENIDNIAFGLLILTIISTAFMTSGIIGCLAGAFSFACLFRLLVKKGEKIELSFINKILIVYLLFVVISLMGASYFVLSLKGFLKTFVYTIFYFSAVYFLSANRKKIIPTIITIAGVTCFEGIAGIMQNISHVEEIATWQDTSTLSDPTKAISRAYGTLKPYNPNLLAGYLVAGLSSVFALFSVSYFKKDKKTAAIYGILFLAVFFAIFVTGSRGAYLGLFGFILVIFSYAVYFLKKRFGGFKQIKTRYKAIAASAVVFLAGVICLIPSFLNRVLSIFAFRKDSSISFRMNVYEACLRMFSDNKFLGIGVGNKNFREIYGLYMKTGYDALGSYCVPLEIAVESGVFALFFFLVFIILICIRCVKYTLKEGVHPVNKILVLSVLLMITGVMFHGFFDTIFFRPQVQIIFWTNIAIFHSITIRHKRREQFRLLK